MTRHIAMVAVTSQSHVYPSLALIRELVDRGHRVSYAVGESQHELVARTGAEIVGHPSLLPDPQRGNPGRLPRIPRDAVEAMQVFLDEAMTALPQLTARYDPDPPELILADPGAMAASVLGHRYGVPVVQLAIMPMTWPDDEEGVIEQMTSLGLAESARRYYEQCDAWLGENGVEGGADKVLGSPAATLSLMPRIMQPGAGRAPASVHFVGPCLDPERLADRSWTPPVDGKRVLLVSLGTSYNDQPGFYRTCVDAFAGSDWHVVLVAGDHAESAEFRHVPAGIEVVRRAPQLTVLETASAFVTHAGMGGCVEALWYAVPTVSIPQGIDQFGNAARLVELGVGRRLRSDEVTPKTLREAVDAVADDPEITRRLEVIRAELRASGGAAAAADMVESFLAPR